MFELDVSHAAKEDIRRAAVYISETFGAPRTAAALVNAVERCYVRLARSPLTNRIIDPSRGYRRAIVKSYVLIYSANEAKKTVRIHRFFHGSQDYLSLL